MSKRTRLEKPKNYKEARALTKQATAATKSGKKTSVKQARKNAAKDIAKDINKKANSLPNALERKRKAKAEEQARRLQKGNSNPNRNSKVENGSKGNDIGTPGYDAVGLSKRKRKNGVKANLPKVPKIKKPKLRKETKQALDTLKRGFAPKKRK